MSKIFVISDTWFNRPMKDDPNVNVGDNNELIITNWNNTVEPDDTVYVLGGFGIADLYNIVVRLHGEIHFLDNYYTKDEKNFIMDMRTSIEKSCDQGLKDRIIFEDKQMMSFDDLDTIVSYFPLSDWSGKDTGTYCFHGMTESTDLYGHNFSCVSQKWNHTPLDIKSICSNLNHIEEQL